MSSSSLQPLLAPPSRLQGWDTTVSVRPWHTAQTSRAFKEINGWPTYLEKHKTPTTKPTKVSVQWTVHFYIQENLQWLLAIQSLSKTAQAKKVFLVTNDIFCLCECEMSWDSVSPDVMWHHDIWINWLSLITVSSLCYTMSQRNCSEGQLNQRHSDVHRKVCSYYDVQCVVCIYSEAQHIACTYSDVLHIACTYSEVQLKACVHFEVQYTACTYSKLQYTACSEVYRTACTSSGAQHTSSV